MDNVFINYITFGGRGALGLMRYDYKTQTIFIHDPIEDDCLYNKKKEGCKQPDDHIHDDGTMTIAAEESKLNREPTCILNVALADKMWNDARTALESTCHCHNHSYQCTQAENQSIPKNVTPSAFEDLPYALKMKLLITMYNELCEHERESLKKAHHYSHWLTEQEFVQTILKKLNFIESKSLLIAVDYMAKHGLLSTSQDPRDMFDDLVIGVKNLLLSSWKVVPLEMKQVTFLYVCFSEKVFFSSANVYVQQLCSSLHTKYRNYKTYLCTE